MLTNKIKYFLTPFLIWLFLSVPAFAQSVGSSGCNFPLIDTLISILPQTPTDLKLQVVMTEFATQAPIGSAIIFEAYSAVWSLLSVVAFFKGIKLLVMLKQLFFI